VKLSIYRGDATAGEMVTYDVPVREGTVVLDAVLWVQANLATDLAVRWNCKAAKCGSCSAEINGFPRLMCKSPVTDYGASISVRPMRTFSSFVIWSTNGSQNSPPAQRTLMTPSPGGSTRG